MLQLASFAAVDVMVTRWTLALLPAVHGLKVPDWDYAFPTANETCVDASSATPGGKTNARWVFSALPEGTPPAGGWPVWFSLVTDTYGPMTTGATCGGGGGHGGWSRTKPFSPFDTPQKSMTSCFAPPPSPEAEGAVGAEAEGLACSYEMSRYCRTAEREGAAKCLACAGANAARLKGRCTQAELNAICNGTHPGPSPSPYPPHHHGRGDCDYDQEAGALWNQRLKQYLIANGVAVVVVVRAAAVFLAV